METDADDIVRRVPAHLVKDFDVVAARPVRPRMIRRRNDALRRLSRWWCDEQKLDEAAALLRRYKTALHITAKTGFSYRYGRKVQDRIQGGVYHGRGKTWAP